jgi:hypothetical protein
VVPALRRLAAATLRDRDRGVASAVRRGLALTPAIRNHAAVIGVHAPAIGVEDARHCAAGAVPGIERHESAPAGMRTSPGRMLHGAKAAPSGTLPREVRGKVVSDRPTS